MIFLHTVSYTFTDQLRLVSQDLFWPEPNSQGEVVYPIAADIMRERSYLFVVAHGSGVPPYGLETCRLGIETLVKEFYQKSSFSNVPTQLQSAFQVANEAVHDHTWLNFEEPILGNSMVAAVIKENELTIANVGYTAAYLIKETHIEELVPLGRPPLPDKLALLTYLLGTDCTPLPIRTNSLAPVPLGRPYLDMVNQTTIGYQDILILTSNFAARPGLLEEKKIFDQVKYVEDRTIARRLAETASLNSGSRVEVTITAIWFTLPKSG